MQTIKIFLASSVVEFKRERQELAAFVSFINNKSVKRDIFLEIRMCEELSNAMALERKQDEYNEYIRESDFVLILIGKTVGQYTIEEFDVAWEHFQKHGKPDIFTYFREFPQGEQVQESVLTFKERLDKQLGHYYSQYTDLDTVKVEFLQEMYDNALELRDGYLFLDEQQVLAVEDVPFYKDALQRKRERKKELDEEYAALMPRLAQAPSEEGLSSRKEELVRERAALQRMIYQMETDLFQERQEMVQKRRLGMHMNWREKKAAEWVDKGDYESAKNILRDVQWEEEIEQSEKRMKLFGEEQGQRQLVEIRRYIYGKRLLISYLKITGLDRDSVEEIKAIYENITEKAFKYQMEHKVLQEYAEFLIGQNCAEQGIAVAEKLRQRYKNDEKTLTKHKAEFLLWLADRYSDVKQGKKSKQCISEALEILPLLYNDLEREGLTALADVKMAYCLRIMRQVKEAKKWSREALELSAGLAEQNPQDDTLRWILGETRLNFVYQLRYMGKSTEAERDCRKAVEIYEDLAGNYPSNPSWCSLFPEREDMAYGLQKSYNLLAIIMEKTKREKEAESLYRKALETARSIAGRNPLSKEELMALVCRNLATLLDKKGNQRELLLEADSLYQESKKIYTSLFKRNPQCYRDKAAQIHSIYVDFLNRMRQWGFYENDRVYYYDNMEYDTLCDYILDTYFCAIEFYPDTYFYAMDFYAMDLYSEAKMGKDEWGKRKSEPLASLYRDTASFYWNNRAKLSSNYHMGFYDVTEWFERAIDIYSQLAKDSKGKPQEHYAYQEAKICLELAHILYQQHNSSEDFELYSARGEVNEEIKEIEPLYELAVDIFECLYEKNPTEELQKKLLEGYRGWTQMMKRRQQSQELDEICRETREMENQERWKQRRNQISIMLRNQRSNKTRNQEENHNE